MDRDFCFLLAAYDIDPGSYARRSMTMLDFNLWTWNSRLFRASIHSTCARVIASHAHWQSDDDQSTRSTFTVMVRGHRHDGGPVPKTARWPEVTTDIGVGQMRQIEFIAPTKKATGRCTVKSHHHERDGAQRADR